MNSDKITYAIIKKAVDHSFDAMQENLERGLRNLIDLGVLFSVDRFQRVFLRSIQSELRNPESSYYRLAKRFVSHVRRDQLTTFCMNLGYNSWSAGARKLCNLKNEYAFSLPWVVFFDLTYMENHLLPIVIGDVIAQGKELGIYSYTFCVEGDYPYLHELLDVLAEEKDCAFCLFADAKFITPAYIEQVTEIKTILTLLRVGEDRETTQRAAEMLLENHMLCGAFAPCKDASFNPEPFLSEANALGFSFLFLLYDPMYHAGRFKSESVDVQHQRELLKLPVFPVDFYRDVANIQHQLCSYACLISVRGDGAMTFMKTDTPKVVDEYNVYEDSLKEVFVETALK